MSRTLELRVSRVNQLMSGGSFVVRFNATIELLTETLEISAVVVSTIPSDADPANVEDARQAIMSGFASVLRSRGVGANVRLQDVVIHDVDFKPRAFERFSAESLASMLSSEGSG